MIKNLLTLCINILNDENIIKTRAYLDSYFDKPKRAKVIRLLNANKTNITYDHDIGAFKIRSEKFLNKFYQVYPHLDKAWGCSCTGSSLWNVKECKHIRTVKAFILSKPELVKKFIE